jgi:hypothetical protein
MPIKLQIRRGTASQWTSANPTLLAGEIGYETDTGNFKVGDNSTAWTSLAYQFPYATGTKALDTTTLVVDQTNDRIGIGTSSPLSQLHVESAAPVLRFRDTGADAGTHSLISADNVDGTLTISADAGNNTGTSSVSKIQFVVDGTTTSTVLPNAVGIGTSAPVTNLHIESASATIRLRDTDGPANAYSQIVSNNADGSITIDADPAGAGTGASSVSLSVDGATRVQATTTGATINGICAATTFSGSGASLSANTIPHSALTNLAAAGFLGRNAAGAVSALTVATAQTMLGLGSLAYLSSIELVNDVTLNYGNGDNTLDFSTLKEGINFLRIIWNTSPGVTSYAKIQLTAGEFGYGLWIGTNNAGFNPVNPYSGPFNNLGTGLYTPITVGGNLTGQVAYYAVLRFA